MFRTIEDFSNTWKHEREATEKIFNVITGDVLNRHIPGYNRTLGNIAWHIALWTGEIGKRSGLTINCPDYNSDAPSNISEISAVYKTVANELLSGVCSKWTDEYLYNEKEIYGKIWKNGKTLESIIRHQIHHRGQMTVIMRILKLPVPGIYGPSKEEWVNFGMEPQK